MSGEGVGRGLIGEVFMKEEECNFRGGGVIIFQKFQLVNMVK